MYNIMHGSNGNVIGIKVTRELRSEDYATLLPFTHQMIRERGMIRVLTDLTDFDHPNHWANFKASFKILKYAKFVEKDAIVSDAPWVLTFAKLVAPFFKTEVRVFPSSQISQAWDWARR